jgi:hypothetical protein
MNANILLAFLLGLQSPDVDLTNTKVLLRDLGDALYFNADDWDEINAQLETIFENNVALNRAYQAAMAALEALDGPIPSELLPTEDELEQATLSEGGGAARGYHPDKDEGKSGEIVNVLVAIVNHKEPDKLSKTLLRRISDFIKRQKA